MGKVDQMGAIRPHSTATDDESNWDAAAATGKMNPTASNLKAMHAYQDPEGADDAKSTYSFPHHNANADGSVGAANTSACSAGIAALNGGRGGHSMSTDDKVGVYNHLSKHIEDAGKEAPPLKGAGASDANASSRSVTLQDNGAPAADGASAGYQPEPYEQGPDEDVICPKCQKANADDAVFCDQCGFKLAGAQGVVTSDGDDEDEEDGATVTITSDGEPLVSTDNNFQMPVMVIEGAWTGDARYVVPGALTWRDLPLPAMALKTTTMDHTGADLVGKLTDIDRRATTDQDFDARTQAPHTDGTNIVYANGMFDTAENAAEIKRLVGEQFLRGVSVDIGDAVTDLVWLDVNGDECPENNDDDDWDLFDLLFGFNAAAEPQAGEPYTLGEKIIKGRIMGATICPFPAFEGAFVQVGDVAMAASAGLVHVPDQDRSSWLPSIRIVDRQGERKMPASLTASALAAPMVPPAAWFEDPKLSMATAITIEQTGEIFGHLALWNECHMSYTSQCVKAPHSRADYAYMHTGCVLCDNDEVVPTGVITMDTGHAELWQDANSAKAHYDNTGSVVADASFGEDEFGIWFHGSLRPDVDELSVRRLRGAALSGDWRTIGGYLELVAALAVNVPGFPVKRPASRVAGGAPVALVAAGRLTQREAKRLHEQGVPLVASAPEFTALPSRDMDVLVGYVRRDLRSQVHCDGR